MYFNHAFRKTLLGATGTSASAQSAATITAATSSLVTGTTSLYLNTITATHALVVGQTVTIASAVNTGGASTAAFNGTFTVASISTTVSFTVYSTVNGGTWASGGTATGLATSTLLGATATATGDLTAGQLGIYNQNFGAINYTTAADKTPFYLVQGSYYKNSGYSDKIGSHGGYQESVKSKMINPKYISRIFWVQSKLPVQQVVQIPLTAQSGSTNVGLNADTTYRLRIDVKGSPALRFLSHNIYRVMDTYTGPLNAINPTFLKDPVATLVDFKEQLTMSPYFNQLVQARAYKLSYLGTGSTTVGTITTTSAVLSNANFTTANGVAIGQRVTGPSIPANSFVTAFTSGTSATISFPAQSVAPTIATITGTAPSVVKFYNDLYGSNGGYVTPYTNIAVTSGQQPTYVGQTPYIPGSSAYTTGTSQTAGTATGATIVANTAGTSIGAIIYQPVADAASFTTDAFLELTAAYLETKFGNPTFTISDNYDLEPLKIIASLMDDSGSTTVVAPIGTAAAQTIGEAGIATVAQASSMAQGTGETVLRELILTGRYRQEAFGDGTNIDQFRMREIEANPSVLSMMSVANRNALYNKLCILHSVPRFNNPTGVFDNDQYLIEVAIPNTLTVDKLFNTATYTSGGTITGAAGGGLGDYILEASITAGGVQYAEMI